MLLHLTIEFMVFDRTLHLGSQTLSKHREIERLYLIDGCLPINRIRNVFATGEVPPCILVHLGSTFSNTLDVEVGKLGIGASIIFDIFTECHWKSSLFAWISSRYHAKTMALFQKKVDLLRSRRRIPKKNLKSDQEEIFNFQKNHVASKLEKRKQEWNLIVFWI